MHSGGAGNFGNINNNVKYTNGVLVDNGYHYFPNERERELLAENLTINAPKVRPRNKWSTPNDVLVPQRTSQWPHVAVKDHNVSNHFNHQGVNQQRSGRSVPKKQQQLLPFVHQQSDSKRSMRPNYPMGLNNNNNNNDNNNQRIEQIFPLDVQPIIFTPTSTPNKEFREDKSLAAYNFQTDQHYEHYYSYYYNRQPNFQQRKVRKLPDTSTMAAAKKNAELQLNQNLDPHVLKEQINNNNILVCEEDEAWRLMHAASENKFATGDFVDVKKYDLSVEDFCDTARSRFKYEQHEVETPEEEPLVNGKVQVDVDIRPRNVRQTGGEVKLKPNPLEKDSKNIQEASLKKPSSPRPRVLLYNQSPRPSRATYAYVGARLQEWRRQQQSKSPAVNASEKIKKRYLNGLSQASKIVNADCYVVDGRRTPSPVAVGHSFVLGNEDRHAHDDVSSIDDEVDDELDNVSDFGSDISGSSSDEDGYRSYAYKLAHAAEKNLNQIASRSATSLLSDSSDEPLKNPKSLLAPSLFPNVPPYLAFSSNTSKGPNVPPELYRILKWRISNVMPKVVRHILTNSGMRLLKKTNDWMGVWGKHLKSPCFRTIRPYQKINHLPGSFKIGRKDSLWKSLQKHCAKHSKKDFGFMPKTYIIPNDLLALRKAWPRYASRNVKWIIKPPASARGAGIRVVSKWAQIPKRRPLIVQRYIERPLLINGSKFDLRLYVLVTSMNPLRVYLYHNGLARFASVKYSDRTDTLHDRCMHLTNYSINKLSSNYAKNEDVNACHGHKWTIKSLWNYLASRGVRTDYLWDALRALVVRTLLVGESSINNMIRMNVESKYSVYELFGFDILLDADLIPWLLEVNISPSLHSELPLDAHVKAPLVQAVLNTALYNIPPKLSPERQKDIAARMSYHGTSPICYDKRMYINYLSRVEKVKHNTFTRKTLENREEYLSAILEHLTPDDVRCLIIAEDELARCSPLERIFPTKDTHKYLKYNDTPRYYNRLLDAWETRYAGNRQAGIGLLTAFCLNRYHLQVPQAPVKKDSPVEDVKSDADGAAAPEEGEQPIEI